MTYVLARMPIQSNRRRPFRVSSAANRRMALGAALLSCCGYAGYNFVPNIAYSRGLVLVMPNCAYDEMT